MTKDVTIRDTNTKNRRNLEYFHYVFTLSLHTKTLYLIVITGDSNPKLCLEPITLRSTLDLRTSKSFLDSNLALYWFTTPFFSTQIVWNIIQINQMSLIECCQIFRIGWQVIHHFCSYVRRLKIQIGNICQIFSASLQYQTKYYLPVQRENNSKWNVILYNERMNL